MSGIVVANIEGTDIEHQSMVIQVNKNLLLVPSMPAITIVNHFVTHLEMGGDENVC